MNKTDARKIAENITKKQLKQMLDTAKEKIKDWTQISAINKGMTKGTTWNILTAGIDTDDPDTFHILAVTNMVWEFGDFLPDKLKIKKVKKKSINEPPYHEDPNFKGVKNE